MCEKNLSIQQEDWEATDTWCGYEESTRINALKVQQGKSQLSFSFASWLSWPHTKQNIDKYK